MRVGWWCITLIGACIFTAAAAGDRDEFNRRSMERWEAMFRMNDANGDNAVTREEARGTVELISHFDDIDINRDGIISSDELARYLDANYR